MNLNEMYDIYNEKGKPLNKTMPRVLVHGMGAWHKTVHVWIVKRSLPKFTIDSWILFQQRSLKKDSHPGIWDISAAGHVDAGESCIEAAIRETQEELGLNLKTEELNYLGDCKLEYTSDNGFFIDREIQSVYVVELPELDLADLMIDPEEVSDIELRPLVEVQKMLEEQAISNIDFVSGFGVVDHREEYKMLVDYLKS